MHEPYQQPDYTVERLQPEDVEAMNTMYTKVWLGTFGTEGYGISDAEKEAWVQRYNSPEAVEEVRRATTEDIATAEKIWLVAKDHAGAIVGMARPMRADEEGLQRVGAIYVDQDHQGSGVSDQLMDGVIAWSDPKKPLYLWVAPDNERAQGFYRKFGFEVVPDKPPKTVYGTVTNIQMARKGDEQS